jgi:hypothetical protein
MNQCTPPNFGPLARHVRNQFLGYNGDVNQQRFWGLLARFACKLGRALIPNGGSSSVVERQLPKLNVAGSIPVSRSNQFNNLGSIGTLSSAVNSV